MNQDDIFPLVSIITINYNHSDVTAECLNSLQKISYPNIEIIVIDNASPEEDSSWLKKKYPYINYIKSDKNLGFAGGNNIGIKVAKGKYILLLNNDTEVEPDFLEPLVDKLKNNSSIGAVSPKIKYHHTPNMLQYTGFTPINELTIRNHAVGFNQIDKGQFDKDSKTFYAHGAAMLVPRKVIQQVGMMADIFFLYYEELDWGYRIRKSGKEIHYVHNSVILHKESVSTGLFSPMQVYYLNRSRILYMRRNIKGFRFLLSLLYLLFISIPKNYFTFFIKQKPKLLLAYHKAMIWHFKNSFNKSINDNPKL
ncbi:MAG: glycosyltransferase family 2 protein [Bacteroidota bacterium]|nr:glycosyltransferase family 2 protein [Bacteroidota bacterium]